MSKGPGKLQRMILDALKERECFYLIDLLGDSYTGSQYHALQRAANGIPSDKAQIVRFSFGRPRIVIARAGLPESRILAFRHAHGVDQAEVIDGTYKIS